MDDFLSGAALALPAQYLLRVLFALIAGMVQGRTTGSYPTVEVWCAALRTLQDPAPGGAALPTAGMHARRWRGQRLGDGRTLSSPVRAAESDAEE